MMMFLAIAGIALLFMGAWWMDKRREAEMIARLEKLRHNPEAVCALLERQLAERKRDTEAFNRLRDHRCGWL